MRPWDAFSAHKADDYDYAGLADALKPDWDLLDHDHWRRDFKSQYGHELDDDAIDRHAELASAVLGEHPNTAGAVYGSAHFGPDKRREDELAEEPSAPTQFARPAAHQLLDQASREGRVGAFLQRATPEHTRRYIATDYAHEQSEQQAANPKEGGGPFALPSSSQLQSDSGLDFEPFRVAGGGKGILGSGKKLPTLTPKQNDPVPQPAPSEPNQGPRIPPLTPLIRELFRPELPSLEPPPLERPGAGLPAGATHARSDRSRPENSSAQPKARGKPSLLERDMEANGFGKKPEGWNTHHIFVQGYRSDPDVAAAAKKLNGFGVGIHSHYNGVYLPPDEHTLGRTSETPHRSLHTNDYRRRVARSILEAETREDAIRALDDIRHDLSKKRHPRGVP